MAAWPAGFIPGLDLIRASAILLVLVAHAPWVAQSSETLTRLKANGGPLGVDLFFALSGFLIGGMLIDTGDRLREPRVVAGFWLSRWIRTLPNFYLFLAINLVLWTWLFTRRELACQDVMLTAVFCQNLTHPPGSFFGEAWSLSVEEWFYLLLPLGLWVGLRAGLRFKTVLAALLVVMFVVSFARRALIPVGAGGVIEMNMIVLNKFDALGCGVAAAWLARAWPELWRRWAPEQAWGGAILIAGCAAFAQWPGSDQHWFSRSWLPLLQPLGCALLLAASCQWRGWRGRVLSTGTASLARWAYSLYLVNGPVDFALRQLMPVRSVGWSGVLLSSALFLLLSFALAAGLYRWFERPILQTRGRIALCREAALARQTAADASRWSSGAPQA